MSKSNRKNNKMIRFACVLAVIILIVGFHRGWCSFNANKVQSDAVQIQNTAQHLAK